MRINIVIDDDLMRAALKASGVKTERQVVEEALRMMIRIRRQHGLRALRGKAPWHGAVETRRRTSSSASARSQF